MAEGGGATKACAVATKRINTIQWGGSGLGWALIMVQRVVGERC